MRITDTTLFYIFLTVFILMIAYSSFSGFSNIDGINNSVYPTDCSAKIYTGHVPGNNLGLSSSEKELLFHKFINNGDELI